MSAEAGPPVVPVDDATRSQQGSAGDRGQRWYTAPWVGPAVAVLVTVFVVFGVLDAVHTVFPVRVPASSTAPFVVGAPVATTGPGSTRTVLSAAPGELDLRCQSSGAVVLANTSGRPLRWQVVAVPAGLVLAVGAPGQGLLAPHAQVRVGVTALGAAGANVLTIGDELGEQVPVRVLVSCG